MDSATIVKSIRAADGLTRSDLARLASVWNVPHAFIFRL